MRKIIILSIITLSSFCCFSQVKDSSDVFKSEKYQKLKEYYIQSLDSNKTEELNAIKKDLISQIGKDNFLKMKDSNNITEWLRDNWKSTSFTSFEESEIYLAKFNKLNDELKELAKEMTPLFSELRKEVGYSVLFKKLSEDYNKSILN